MSTREAMCVAEFDENVIDWIEIVDDEIEIIHVWHYRLRPDIVFNMNTYSFTHSQPWLTDYTANYSDKEITINAVQK